MESHQLSYNNIYSWISLYMKPFKTFIFDIYIVTKTRVLLSSHGFSPKPFSLCYVTCIKNILGLIYDLYC